MSKLLSKVKTYTPEQLERLRTRLNTDDSFRQELKNKMSNTLDAAQRTELVAILNGKQITQEEADQVPAAQQVAQQVASIDEAAGSSIFEKAVEFAGEAVQSVGETALDAATGLGSAFEIAADIGDPIEFGVRKLTGTEEVPGEPFSSFNERQDAFRAGLRKQSQERSPVAFGAAKFAGEVAQGAAAGGGLGLAVKGATKATQAGKAIQAANSLVSKSPALAKGLQVIGASAGDVLVSAANIQALKGDTDVMNFVEEASTQAIYMGGALSMVGAAKKALGGIKAIRGVASQSVEKGVEEAADRARGGFAMSKVKDIFDETISREASSKLDDTLKYTKEELTQAVDNLPEVKRYLEKGVEGASLPNVIQRGAKRYGAEHDKVSRQISAAFKFNGVSEVMPYTEVLSLADDIARAADDIVAESAGSLAGQAQIQTINNLKGFLKAKATLAETTQKGLSIEDSNVFLGELNKFTDGLRGTTVDGADLFAKAKNLVTSNIDTIGRSIYSQDEKLLKEFESTMSNLITSDKLSRGLNKVANQMGDVEKVIFKEGGDIIKQVLREAAEAEPSFKNLKKGLGVVTTATDAYVGVPITSSIIVAKNAAKMAPGLAKKYARNPQQMELLTKVSQVGKYLNGQTEQAITNSPWMKSVLASTTRHLGTLANPNALAVDEIYNGLYGSIELKKNPIQRNTQDFHAKKNEIISSLKLTKPEVASVIEDALSKGDDIGPIMEKLSSLSIAQEVVAPGLGWDGKTWDEGTKIHIRSQLDNAHLVPAFVKNKIIEDLAIGQPGAPGIIPDLNSLPIRKPKKSRNGI